MKSREITLRSFAERQGDRWYMHCIDLTLDAQGSSYSETRAKLDDAIILHLEWALGAEPRTVRDLLRPSPLEFRLRYVRAWVRQRLTNVRDALLRRRLPGLAAEEEFVTHPDISRDQRKLPAPA